MTASQIVKVAARIEYLPVIGCHCGRSKLILGTAGRRAAAADLVGLGWRVVGQRLYCPECIRNREGQ